MQTVLQCDRKASSNEYVEQNGSQLSSLQGQATWELAASLFVYMYS